jgi:hypothetical protein
VTERETDLNRIKHLLNTPDGEVLVDELEDAWDQNVLLGSSPERTAYNVGLRDAFKFIRMLQTGELIHE